MRYSPVRVVTDRLWYGGDARYHLRRAPLEHGEEDKAMELSARNQLAGTVMSVKHGGVMAEITVQIAGGQELVSVITRSSAERLNLQAGDQITVIIKSTEVMLGK